MIIKGYNIPLQHNRRCEGCGVKIGPDTPIKTGYEVKDGELTGFFHSRECFTNNMQKFEKFKEERGQE